MELLLTFLVGFLVFIGTIIVFKVKNTEKLLSFSIAMAISVLSLLAIFEILPESIEMFEGKYNKLISILFVIGITGIGIVILKLIDKFIPDHHHTEKKGNRHLEHIALITTIALFVHNIIEGMALYSSILVSISTGLIFGIGIGLHNIALGLTVSNSLYNSNKSKKQTVLLMLILSISTFLGGLLMYAFNPLLENSVVLGIILSLTLGMIIYIVLFELLHEMIGSKNKKLSVLGFTVGVLIMLIAMFLE